MMLVAAPANDRRQAELGNMVDWTSGSITRLIIKRVQIRIQFRAVNMYKVFSKVQLAPI